MTVKLWPLQWHLEYVMTSFGDFMSMGLLHKRQWINCFVRNVTGDQGRGNVHIMLTYVSN